MSIIDGMLGEFVVESATTWKMLERVPEDKFGWKPHDKSMTLNRLAGHIAEIPGLTVPILTTTELNFSTAEYKPAQPATKAELLALFDKNVAEAKQIMQGKGDEHMMVPWRLSSGDKVFFELPRVAALRSMVFSHSFHHRGQLSVYLRLLNVPLPCVYGPTADESAM